MKHATRKPDGSASSDSGKEVESQLGATSTTSNGSPVRPPTLLPQLSQESSLPELPVQEPLFIDSQPPSSALARPMPGDARESHSCLSNAFDTLE
jgi:hypothetical protein